MSKNEFLIRTVALLGEGAVATLLGSTVGVFGLGGVGSYVAEALARSGIGNLVIIDCDKIEPSNINRQLFALHSTVGQRKTEAAEKRLKDINPEISIDCRDIFINEDTIDTVDFSKLDYVVDAVDTVSAKLLIIERCKQVNTPIISCLGTGGRFDGGDFEFADIKKTSYCPLARVMRRELAKRNICDVEVIYSKEKTRQGGGETIKNGTRPAPPSCAFVPSIAGLRIAGRVVLKLCGEITLP